MLRLKTKPQASFSSYCVDNNTLYQGDWIEVLQTLIKRGVKVNCCVTSPPYWNLRDYQTGRWEGGDPDCDHSHFRGGHGEKSVIQIGSQGTQQYQYRKVCAKCKAKRVDQQLGLEDTPEEYISKLVKGFRLVRELLTDDGTLWVNIGDTYSSSSMSGTGSTSRVIHSAMQDKQFWLPPRTTPGFKPKFKPKQLLGIPWRLAFALQADMWWLRQDIIWHKLNTMPESVEDRCVKSHEYVFLLSKSANYFFDHIAIQEPGSGQKSGNVTSKYPSKDIHFRTKQGLIALSNEVWKMRNKRSVWTINPEPFKESHFAVFPTQLVEPPILAGTSAHGHCPECGKGWQRTVEKEKRNYTPHTMTEYQVHKLKFKGGGDQGKYLGPRKRKEKGWEPSCDCNAGDPVPGVVLDPFSGSGTVGVVAWKHHRHSVLIELNSDYVEMARKRLAGLGPLFSTG